MSEFLRAARKELLDRATSEVMQLRLEISDLLRDKVSSSSEEARMMYETLSIVEDFLVNPLLEKAYMQASADFVGRQPMNEDGLNALIRHVDVARQYLDNQYNPIAALNEMASMRGVIKAAINKVYNHTHIMLSEEEYGQLYRQMSGMDGRLRLAEATDIVDHALDRIAKAEQRAENSATQASTAAGKTSEDTISTYYQDMADKEGKVADTYRKWTIRAGVGAGATAAIFLILPEFGWLRIGGADYAHLIQRIVVTAAILGLAGYFARQAQQHRLLAVWAEALAVQLKTFNAYIEPISDHTARNDLRKTFASRAFGEHPTMKGDAQAGVSQSSLEAAVDVVAKLAPGSK